MSIGRKKQLALDDLYDPLPEDSTKDLTDEFEQAWQKEKSSAKKPTIFRPILKIYAKRIVLNCFFIFFQEMLKIIQPFLISLVLKYFNDQIKLEEVVIYACIIAVAAIIGGILHHPYYLNTGHYGIKLRLICSSLVYRKVIQLILITESHSNHLIHIIESIQITWFSLLNQFESIDSYNWSFLIHLILITESI